MSLSLPDFNLTDERREFRDTLRRFFEEHAPLSEARRLMASEAGSAPHLWKRACQELGLAGLAIAEAHGGQGFGLCELALALQETGRCLAPLPLFASAGLAARAVEAVSGARDAGEWLAPIAASGIATLAWVERADDWGVSSIACEARADGAAATRITGVKSYVLCAHEAERFFVVAREPGSAGLAGVGLFAVERAAAGLVVAPRETLDPTRKLATLRLDSAPARRVGRPGADGAALVRALEEATALFCAELVGGMQCVLETAVAYAQQRFQFGRAIGSFQAIKHKCADMLIAFEGARTAADAAVTAAADASGPAASDAADSERGVLASVAKAHCGRAYVQLAQENLQIHGGVGYTWEYDAHLFYRRAISSNVLLGDAAAHHERLAHALLAEAS